MLALTLLILAPYNAVASIPQIQTKSKAQKYAEKKKKDTIRAWAQYTGFASMDLESFAAAAARVKLAEAMEVYVEKIVEHYNDAAPFDKINETGMAVKEYESLQKSSSRLKSVTDALIRNSRVVLTDRYVDKDGTVVCYAAVEVRISDIETVSKTSQAVSNALKEIGVDVTSKGYEKATKDTHNEYLSGKLDLSTL